MRSARATPTRPRGWRSDESVDEIYNAAVPRAGHLHDGRPAEHHAVNANAVSSPKKPGSARRRPRHQWAEKVFYAVKGEDRGRSPEGRCLGQAVVARARIVGGRDDVRRQRGTGHGCRKVYRPRCPSARHVVRGRAAWRPMLRYNLEKQGFASRSGGRAEELTRIAESSPTRDARLDVAVMYGIEVCRQIQPPQRDARSPVIRVTAAHRGQDAGAAEHRADDDITKT